MEKNLYLDNKIVLRVAEPKDISDVYALVDDYSEEIEVNKTRVKESLRDILYIHGILIVELNGEVVGGVAGFVLPSMLTDEHIFTANFFYMRKPFRKHTTEALKELELCLLPTKVNRIIFGIINTVNAEKYKRFMRMQGYKELETHYYKKI